MRRLLLLSAVVLTAACANDPTSPSAAPRNPATPSWGIGTSPSRQLPGIPTAPEDTVLRGIGTSPSVTNP
jgi:hypothetical protein